MNHWRFLSNTYLRGVLTLVTGTTLSQLIPIVVSPALTRLYDPSDFGQFALYIAVGTTTGVVVTGRYEQAINLPKSDIDAIQIATLSVILSFIVSATLFVLIAFFASSIAMLLGDATLSTWLYLLPITTFITGLYTVLSYWCNRRAQYSRIAVSRTSQTFCTATAQIAAGYQAAGTPGLIGGQLLGQVLSTAILAKLVYQQDRTLLFTVTLSKMTVLAKRYSSFPKYMIVGQLLNAASGYMPLFMLTYLYGASVAGFYALSQRVLLMPISFIGSAIGEVYRSEASQHYRNHGNCKEIYKKTFYLMAALSLLVAIPAFTWGPQIFSVIFGQSWGEAGKIASLLSILIFFQGISSPTSETLLFAGFLKVDLLWQSARFVLSAGSLYLGYKLNPNDSSISIILFVAAFSLMYVIHSAIQYNVAKGRLQ